MQRARCPWALALASAGRRRLARMAIMAMTTSNSMRVNAERARGAMFMGNQAQARFSAAEKRALFWNDLGCLGLQRIFAASGISFENAADLISHFAEDSKYFFLRALS